MQCPICRTADTKWQNVDRFRIKPENMSLCMTCGFISYPTRYKSKSEILTFYKTNYRDNPTIDNMYAGERKIHYHAHFLEELLAGWRNAKRKDVLITDVGSAFGLFLNWIKHQVPGSTVLGVELTPSFVRNAWHLFQIKTLEDFDDSQKYDLISSYKSLEHILDPDVELRRYIEALKPDGYLYLAVPIWFGCLRNFGKGGFDLEYYYHPNHINTWTKKHFEGLIKVCGGEVVKENHSYYDSAYLIRRNDELRSDDRSPLFEDPDRILDCLAKVFGAGQAFMDGQFGRCLAIWPDCPPAWLGHYEMSRKTLHEKGFDYIYEEICKKALAATNGDAECQLLAADICSRYDLYEKAIEHLNAGNQMRPNLPQTFAMLANAFRALASNALDADAKVKFYEQARKASQILGEISSQHKGEATTWMMFDNANIPTPFEGS